TIASALTFTVFLLAANPDEQRNYIWSWTRFSGMTGIEM
ncbi:unnamed protein product, partial [Allacma fusca]